MKLWPLSLHHLSHCFKNKSDLLSEDFGNASPPIDPPPSFVAPFDFVFEVVLESVCDPRSSIALKSRNPPGASSPSIFIALQQTRAPKTSTASLVSYRRTKFNKCPFYITLRVSLGLQCDLIRRAGREKASERLSSGQKTKKKRKDKCPFV